MTEEAPQTDGMARDWTRGQIVVAAGALINSALYLTSVFVAALVLGHPLALAFSVSAMGVAFIRYDLGLTVGGRPVYVAALASQALGVVAGAALAWGMFR